MVKSMMTLLLAAGSVVLLSACGGGGGGGVAGTPDNCANYAASSAAVQSGCALYNQGSGNDSAGTPITLSISCSTAGCHMPVGGQPVITRTALKTEQWIDNNKGNMGTYYLTTCKGASASCQAANPVWVNDIAAYLNDPAIPF
ncbi:MAG: hypothetical protein OEV94_05440 [Deltaproteobacteria bacterium]|nr:hypothetical protein [Deltaproteobacteria bacterium]